MVDVDIFGSCVTRDVFGYDDAGAFKVREFISRNSILAAVSLPPRDIHVNYESTNVHEWAIKCIRTDFTKDAFSRLSNSPARMLIIDLIDERHQLIKLGESMVTNSVFLQESRIMDSINETYDFVNIGKLSKSYIENSVSSFAARIKSIYKNENIIINKCFMVEKYKSVTGEVFLFEKERLDTIYFFNTYLAELYKLMEENIPGCRIIEMPEDTVADEKNKWGLAPFHYSEEFYRNVLNRLPALQ